MLAQTGATPLSTRVGVAAVAILVGVVLVVTGIASVRTRTAQESGGRRLVNRAAGRDNTYTGSSAAALGVLRIVLGVAAIGFGVVFAVLGPVLA